MLWFSKGNHRASLKLEIVPGWFTEIWESETEGSISSMKIKHRLNTDSIKCTLQELFIQSDGCDESVLPNSNFSTNSSNNRGNALILTDNCLYLRSSPLFSLHY